MPPALSEPLPADVIAAAQRGEKIEAIKLLRERTGIGLAEAKDAVEAFTDGNTTLHGGNVQAEGGSLRALSFVVIGVVLLVIGYFFLPAISR